MYNGCKIIIFLAIISLIQGENYYEILGINRSADQDEIRKAFKKLAITYHPDKNSDDPNAHDKFIQLTTAYEILKNNDLRRRYDLYGENGLDKSNKQTYHSWNYYRDYLLYSDDEHVIILERSDYFESVINSESCWFVNFYFPMCSHCHHLAPIWKEVAKLLDGIVKIAAINCEQDRQLCHQVGINAYPTLLYFQKNSQQGVYYVGEKTQKAIIRFALDRLNIHIFEITESQLEQFLHGENIIHRPMLIFICDDQQNCFTSDERLTVAAVFDKLIDVKVFICENDNCHNKIYYNTHAIYLPIYNTSVWEPIFFNDISDINGLIKKLWEQLPNPQELTENGFKAIEMAGSLLKESDVSFWFICFYIGDSFQRDLDLQMKKFSSTGIKLGKIHCGKNAQFCNELGVNRYPMWGMLKGGAFELHQGKNINNDILRFIKTSMKTTNVWALSSKKVLSILQRINEDEVWFLDWYTPHCPPCLNFLWEVRKASLEFDASVVRFGTIDCSIHTTVCNQHNIRYYPTAILINGSNTYQFTSYKTATNIIQFINEKRDPSVIELTSHNFNHKLAKKKITTIWIVDYFAPWCAPCQKLASEWIVVARSLSSLSFVNVASVDCQAEASLCASQEVRSYPNIRMYPLKSEGLSKVVFYNGQRDSLSILTWITRFFPNKINNLNPSDYQKVLNSKRVWIVDFYLPECWQCQKIAPEFAIAAQLVEKVKFGRINCNYYMYECTKANVEAFPTLILYSPKQKRKNTYTGTKITANTAQAIKDEILKIIDSLAKHDEL